jgi:CTD small phosphatase-like protein 2
MQTKKKASRRNGSREVGSPRVSRAQKKASENGQVAGLITSSARKIKPCKLLAIIVSVY